MLVRVLLGASVALVVICAAQGAQAVSPQVPAVVREEVNFDFAWRFHLGPVDSEYAKCSPGTFEDKSSVQCDGLTSNAAATADQCQDACCASSTCDIWQFEDPAQQGGGCWTGKCTGAFNPNTKWTGGMRVKPNPPAPPMGPNVTWVNYTDSSWPLVDVPHDFSINGVHDPSNAASGRSYLPRNVSWYRKHFTLPTDYQGKSIWLYFEGIFREVDIYINGVHQKSHNCGYTSFGVRLDNITALNYGTQENVVAIYVDARSGSGWWYEGSGIYRHVKLIATSKTHVDLFGVFIPTNTSGVVSYHDRSDPGLGMTASEASIKPQVDVINDGDTAQSMMIVFTVTDQTGATVAQGQTSTVSINPGTTIQVNGSVAGFPVELWSIPRPYLYTVNTTITIGGKAVDQVSTTIGFRSIHFDADTGLYLNNQNVKIRGFCDHNNFASVGMAVPDRVNLFRAQAMRSIGGNGWRMSHNPPIPVLLDILDRVGITVMDENRLFGNETDYVYNMGQLVKRDRNHPAVIIWSFCNEAGCEGSAEAGGPAFQAITYKYDGSRPTLANMFTFGDLLGNTIDVQGFSHQGRSKVDDFHAKFPHKAQFMSECCSCTTQRGENTAGNVTLSNFNAPCVESQTNSSNGVAYDSGSMVWTLFDYYGEPSFGGWPHVSSSFGSFDLAGFPKAAVYWYRSFWLNQISDTSPDKPFKTTGTTVVHIVQSWDKPSPPLPLQPSSGKLCAVKMDGGQNQIMHWTAEGQIKDYYGQCAQACANLTECEQVTLADCDLSNKAQIFQYNAANGEIAISANPSYCLDLWGTVGPNVGLFSCHVATNQNWTVHNGVIVSGEYAMSNVNQSSGGGGQLRTVNVYTDAHSVDLQVDGVTVGSQTPINPQFGPGSYATFTSVPYSDKGVTAVAKDANGVAVANTTRHTPGDAAGVVLTIDSPNERSGTGSALFLDGQDAALIRATVVDSNGEPVSSADGSVTFSIVSGPGRIVGSHNGDPTSHELNHSPSHHAYHGLARAIVMVTEDSATPDWHRRRLIQIDVERDHRTTIVPPGKETTSPGIVVQASYGSFKGTVTIPVSQDPNDAVLPTAARSVKPVVV